MRFKITYRDPETDEKITVVEEHHDTPASANHGAISAHEWAVDSAYAYADKGWFKVKEIHEKEI